MMLKSNLRDYSNAYIPVQGTIAVSNTTVPGAAGESNNRGGKKN